MMDIKTYNNIMGKGMSLEIGLEEFRLQYIPVLNLG